VAAAAAAGPRPSGGAGAQEAPAATPHAGMTSAAAARARYQFPHVDGEVLAAVVDGAGDDGVGSDAIGLLQEMESEAAATALLDGCSERTVTLRTARGGDMEPRLIVDEDFGTLGYAGQSVIHIQFDSALLAAPTQDQGSLSSSPPTLRLVTPSGESWPLLWHEPPLTLRPPAFGWYRLILDAPGGHCETRFHLSTVVGDYAEALEDFFDALAWVWDGSNWTEELNDAMLGLVVGVDDFMEMLRTMLGPMIPMLGRSYRSMLDAPRRQLENVLAKAVEEHDGTAVGQTHTAVRDLLQQAGAILQFAPMLSSLIAGGMRSPQDSQRLVGDFHRAAAVFEKARQAACSRQQRAHVREALARVLTEGDRYVTHCRARGLAAALVRDWHSPGTLRSELQRVVDEEDRFVDLTWLVQLQGSGSGFLADMLGKLIPGGAGAAGDGPPVTVESTSFLSAEALLVNGPHMGGLIARWCECNVNGAVVIGSPMKPMPFSAAPSELVRSAHVLVQLMEVGCGYVVHGDEVLTTANIAAEDDADCTLTGMVDRVRATLPLDAHAEFVGDRRRRDRLRDVLRVVRSQTKKGRRFSLRVNSDLDAAVALLRGHHEDSWVGPVLAGVWREMLGKGSLIIFELWILEDGVEKMIAADFGHPHSTFGFYVATRFFDRSYRTCMPGFILAFAEAEVLAQRGFGYWDLGGTNLSPMMQYKTQVAIEMRKSSFFDLLHATQLRAQRVDVARRPEKLEPGVVVADIGEDDLWGAAACRESGTAPPVPKQKIQAALRREKLPAVPGKKAARQGGGAGGGGGAGTASSSNCGPNAQGPPPPPSSSGGSAAAGPTSSSPAASAAPILTRTTIGPKRGPLSNGSGVEEAEASKLAARARFQAFHMELRARGLGATEAAAEALKCMLQEATCVGKYEAGAGAA